MSSRFLNLDTDNTLGGVNTSDSRVASQKAVKDYVDGSLSDKQDTLVSGENIKTLGGVSLVGSGDINVSTSGIITTDGITVNYNSNDALQAHAVINPRNNSGLTIWQGTEAQWESGESKTWYNWQLEGAVSNTWVLTYALGYRSWNSIAYGNNLFVAVCNNDTVGYSNDGINWNSGSYMPDRSSWNSIAYSENLNRFVAVRASKGAYSSDGINWTDFSISDPYISRIVYGNGKFVGVPPGANTYTYYSLDGISWEEGGLLEESYPWDVLRFINNRFIIMKTEETYYAYSTDGITWTSSHLPNSYYWMDMAYGNGKYIAIAYNSNKVAISLDGTTWELNDSNLSSTSWRNIVYGGGKFMVTSSATAVAYSTDGITWTESTISNKAIGDKFGTLIYADDKFVALGGTNGSNQRQNVAYFATATPSCYTDTATPDTTSTVYSAPSVTSALTVSSVTSGAITLSDNNTYYYNQSGDETTSQSIGSAHPDWVCNINNVGVKVGNTMIASITSVTYNSTSKTLTIA